MEDTIIERLQRAVTLSPKPAGRRLDLRWRDPRRSPGPDELDRRLTG